MRDHPNIGDRLARTVLERAGPGRPVMLAGGVVVILAALAASLLLHSVLVSTLLLVPVALGGVAVGLASLPHPARAGRAPERERRP